MTHIDRSMPGLNQVSHMSKGATSSGIKRMHASTLRQCGFTLVEAVIVIVITAIIGSAVAVFIRLPVQGYVDSAARAELTDVADTALRRMARDLRLALPNSIRVSPDGKYLELLLTKTGGRYLAEEDNQGLTSILSFTNASSLSFRAVGPPLAASGSTQIKENDAIVVYNLGPGMSPADAYDCETLPINCNRSTVDSVTVATNTITLKSNRFATQTPTMASPTRRFQVVSTPVTYFCNGGTKGAGSLTRYWDYPIQKTQPTDTAASPLSDVNTKRALLANRVTECTFDYSNLLNLHSALIGLKLTLEIPNSNSGEIKLFHQVHVDNTP